MKIDRSVGLQVLFAMVCVVRVAFGQSSSTGIFKIWQDTIVAMDRPTPEQGKQAEELLRKTLAEHAIPEAACILALFCSQRGDVNTANEVVKATLSKHPTMPATLRSMLGRIQLWCAITEDNPAESERLFKAIVTVAIQSSTPKEERVIDCLMSGAIIGMLEHESAKSPIPIEVLDQGRKALESMNEKILKDTFYRSYQASKARQTRFVGWLDDCCIKTQEEVDALQAHREQEVQMAMKNVTAKKLQWELAKKELQTRRSTGNKMKARIRQIEQEWKLPTPGYPRNYPIEPQYELGLDMTRTITRTDANGTETKENKYTSTEYQNRERDNDAIQKRNNEKSSRYYAAVRHYNDAVTAWHQRDQARKLALFNERKTTEQKIQSWNQESTLIEKEQIDDQVPEVKRWQKTIVNVQDDIRLFEIVRDSVKNNRPQSIFRPKNFEILFYSEEKARIRSVVVH